MNKTFQLFLDIQVAQSLLTIERGHARARAQLGLAVDPTLVKKAEATYLELCRALSARKAFIADPHKASADRMVFFVEGRWIDFYELEIRFIQSQAHDTQCIAHQTVVLEQVGRVVSIYGLDDVECQALELLLGSSPQAWQSAGEHAQRRINSIARRVKVGPIPKNVRAAMFALAANLDTRTSATPPT
jgi:hypothetical protein